MTKHHASAVLALALVAGAAPAVTIGNFSAWANEGQFPFGSQASQIQSFGQTFVTPDTTHIYLSSMTFRLYPFGSNPLSFRLWLREWEGAPGTNYAFGPDLFTSTVVTMTPNDQWQDVTFTVPNVVLNPAKRYIGFMSVIGVSNSGFATVGAVRDPNSYASGDSFWKQGDPMSMTNWGRAGQDDLAFQATFAPVPEPATLAVLGAGLAALAARRRRRR